MILNVNLYLTSLSLKNFATFIDQTINFGPGLNSIVGETGSGKSLILDALQLVLGQRADKKLVRKDSEFTSIEAIFNCQDKNVKNFFNEQGYPYEDNEIVIKRIIYANGKSKSFVNFQSCNLSFLNCFSKNFIDLVGQFENQKLLSENYQLLLLDRFANNSNIKHQYLHELKKYKKLAQDFQELKRQNSELKQKQDYLKFQLEELNNLSPCPIEEKELFSRKNKIANLEKITNVSNELSLLLNGDEHFDGIFDLLRSLSKKVEQNTDIIKVENIEIINDFISWAQEFDYQLNSEANLDIDEEEITQVVEKLDFYQKIKRKYNTDTMGVINILKQIKDEINEIELIDQKVEDLLIHRNTAKEVSYNLAHQLHQTRINASEALCKNLTKEVNKLRMNGATIKINLFENEFLNENGISSISLIAQTNLGEGYFKIKDIASGGELSRILLALRKVVSNQDSISIFLFDEVDSGIGGETALCIGKALQKVSKSSQVIAITHLPQIATFSSHLILVDKKYNASNSRTYSTVCEVTGKSIKEYVKCMVPISQS